MALDIWQLLGLAGGVISALASVMFSVGKLLVGQFEARLHERMNVQDAAQKAMQRHWDERFMALEQAANAEAKEWARVERDILLMKADLPNQYVRRDDYIRNQTVIESKIDGLAIRIENALLKGDKYG
ncbi:MAG: hypothetical protein Q8Q50_02675 [Methylobacter sp.]|nr:hypothetical protein [Methylobacter sp.]